MKHRNKKNNHQRKNQKESKITPKEMYRILWEGRNTEISNLWQRSVLLGTFLVLLWTASGWLYIRYLDLFQDGVIHVNIVYLKELSYGAFILSSFGLLMSELWILMTKASKAWVEYAEGQINCIQTKYNNKVFSSSIDNCFPRHGITGKAYIEERGWNKKIFNTKGGPFSPSKINIMLGILSFVYFLLYWFRVLYFFYKFKMCLLFPLINVIVVMFTMCWIKENVVSSILDKPKYCISDDN